MIDPKTLLPLVPQSINTNWQTTITPPRRDPLAIDLDGDGIETVGIPTSSSPILFDHDADGIKTGTGWVKGDDAWLVLDRNGNGSVDSGRELFGVDTQITVTESIPGTAQTRTVVRNARSGFEALRTLDTGNGTAGSAGFGDGVFDARDAAFAQIRLWQDRNQDGISQAGELFSLASKSITSIALTESTTSTNLGNGNTVTGQATVTRSNGSTTQLDSVDLQASNLNLADNPFYRQFTDTIAWTDAAKALPNMRGSGWLRDMREAMSLGTASAVQFSQKVSEFASTTTRDSQRAELDALIEAWAKTTGRVDTVNALRPVTRSVLSDDGVTRTVRYTAMNPGDYPSPTAGATPAAELRLPDSYYEWVSNSGVAVKALNASGREVLRRLGELEAFNGARFINFTTTENLGSASGGQGAGGGGGAGAAAPSKGWLTQFVINLTAPQIDSINAGYAELRESVYQALVVQTRLRNYLDAVELTVDENGVHFDTTGLASMLATNKASNERAAVHDLLELTKFSGSTLQAVGYDGTAQLQTWLSNAPDDLLQGDDLRSLDVLAGSVAAGSERADIYLGDGGANSFGGGLGNDFILGRAGDDTLSGGGGNDRLLGGAGADSLNGNDGDDVLEGGEGNDSLVDTAGNNSFLGGAGNDTITGHGTFIGGTGDDTLANNDYWGGADTYVFYRGDGRDTISDYGNAAHTDVIKFGTGITASQVVASRSGANMVFKIGSSDQITVSNWFAGGSQYIEELRFADGTVWNVNTLRATEIATLGTAAADAIGGWDGKDLIDGGAGDDTLTGGAGNDRLLGGAGNDALNGNDGDDVLEGGDGADSLTDTVGNNTFLGGAGNDTITGHGTFTGGTGDDTLANNDYWGGADTYVFNRGDGRDTISDYGNAAHTDVIKFGTGITASQVVASRSGANMVFKIGSSDQITVSNWFSGNSQYIEELQFSDGTVWNVNTLRATEIATLGTAAADAIGGWDGKDLIDGGAGDDTLSGGGGNDRLLGGAGADSLNGNDGDDVLDAGEGNDSLVDTVGNNTFLGGAGNDTISGHGTFTGGRGDDVLADNDYWGGADTYVFNRGDGRDTISDYGNAAHADVIKFGAGIATSEVVASRSGNHMVFKIGSSDQITVNNWFSGSSQYIEELQFADGTVWNVNTLRATEIATLGTAAADSIGGWDGKDLIDGGAGDDTLSGGSGNDRLLGGVGNDVLNGNDGDDVLDAGEGNDSIVDTVGNNVLLGGSGNDSITGHGTFTGGTGDDVLADNDYWGGADTYVFNRGDGRDTISDYGNAAHTDVIKFGAGITASQVVASRSGANMVFKIGSSDQITVSNWFAGGSQYIEELRFADGTVWNVNTLRATEIATLGTAAADAIGGWDGKDLIDGGAGDDTLTGGAGNDRLLGGAGNDALNGNDGDDVLDASEGNDSLVDTVGTNVFLGGAGNDTITGHGTFTGGTGDDTLADNDFWGGADTYVFNRGDGRDTISDYGNAAHTDVIKFGTGITASQVVASRSGNHMVFKIGSSDQITVNNWFSGPTQYIEELHFADGTVWNLNTLRATEIATLGTAAADSIGGWDGKDLIDGGAGDDTLSGGGGNDRLLGGAGADALNGNDGDDVLESGEGADSLTDTAGNNTFLGGAGNDTITGHGTFTGGTGDDTLANNDYWGGADTYVFNRGHGRDTISDYGNAAHADVIKFGAGITASQVVASRSGNHMVFKIGADDQITVNNWFSGSSQHIEELQFADGTVWNVNTLRATEIATSGTAAADSIGGWDGKDLIDGGAGDDTLSGGGGNDRLLGGAGADSLNGNDGDDVLEGGEGNDSLVDTAGNNSFLGGAGNDTITGHGTFIGGTGDDTLANNDYWGGADTYVFNRGDGRDTISDYGNAAHTDVIKFGTGITASEVGASRSGNHMVFKIGRSDQITVNNWFSGGSQYIEELQFADGTVWNVNTLRATEIATLGTAAADSIGGWDGKDLIDGGAGDDNLTGGAGNDRLLGGAGNDALNGNDGDDVLDAGEGNDSLVDTVGNNTFLGGAGNDTITGHGTFTGGTGDDTLANNSYWSGADTYVFNRGDGRDTISDYGDAGSTDVIKFGTSITASQVAASRSGNHMVFKIGSSDQITVNNWFSGSSQYIEELQFADGSKLLASQLNGLVSAMAQFNGANGMMTTGNVMPQMSAARMSPHQDIFASSL